MDQIIIIMMSIYINPSFNVSNVFFVSLNDLILACLMFKKYQSRHYNRKYVIFYYIMYAASVSYISKTGEPAI